MWSGSPNSGPERSDFRSGRPDLRPGKPNLGLERSVGGNKKHRKIAVWNHRSSTPPWPLSKKGDFEPEKAVLRSDRADSGSVRARLGLERPRGEWMNRQTDRWMDRCLETHPCF